MQRLRTFGHNLNQVFVHGHLHRMPASEVENFCGDRRGRRGREPFEVARSSPRLFQGRKVPVDDFFHGPT